MAQKQRMMPQRLVQLLLLQSRLRRNRNMWRARKRPCKPLRPLMRVLRQLS